MSIRCYYSATGEGTLDDRSGTVAYECKRLSKIWFRWLYGEVRCHQNAIAMALRCHHESDCHVTIFEIGVILKIELRIDIFKKKLYLFSHQLNV